MLGPHSYCDQCFKRGSLFSELFTRISQYLTPSTISKTFFRAIRTMPPWIRPTNDVLLVKTEYYLAVVHLRPDDVQQKKAQSLPWDDHVDSATVGRRQPSIQTKILGLL